MVEPTVPLYSAATSAAAHPACPHHSTALLVMVNAGCQGYRDFQLARLGAGLYRYSHRNPGRRAMATEITLSHLPLESMAGWCCLSSGCLGNTSPLWSGW